MSEETATLTPVVKNWNWKHVNTRFLRYNQARYSIYKSVEDWRYSKESWIVLYEKASCVHVTHEIRS